jgi:hypothetical protein
LGGKACHAQNTYYEHVQRIENTGLVTLCNGRKMFITLAPGGVRAYILSYSNRYNKLDRFRGQKNFFPKISVVLPKNWAGIKTEIIFKIYLFLKKNFFQKTDFFLSFSSALWAARPFGPLGLRPLHFHLVSLTN